MKLITITILLQFFVNAYFMRVCRIGQESGLISVNPHEMGISSGGIGQFEQKVRKYSTIREYTMKLKDQKPSQEVMDKYALESLRKVRRKEVGQEPEWSRAAYARNEAELYGRARSDFEQYGRFYFSQDKGQFSRKIIWDEVATARAWGYLAVENGLESLPGYSQENLKKAIEFWQTWQNRETGEFWNPRLTDPQNPDPKTSINNKYVPGILLQLGTEPLYPYSLSGKAKITRQMLEEDAHPNHGGMKNYEAFRQICRDPGKAHMIPAVEWATGRFARMTRSDNGLTRKVHDYSSYGQTCNELKLYGRNCRFIGIENWPYRKKMADALIKHASDSAGGDAGLMRNNIELLMVCLYEYEYRRDELLDAIEVVFNGFREQVERDDQVERNDFDYFTAGENRAGAMLHWNNYADASEWGYLCGAELPYRLVVGPYGKFANIIKKKPEEILGHPDYSLDKYFITARNRKHEASKITEIYPHGTWRHDGAGEKSWQVKMGGAQLKAPYFCATWKGDYEILIDGVKAKEVITNLDEVGGLRIADEAAAELKKDEVTLTAKCVKPADGSFISLGLIDWSK